MTTPTQAQIEAAAQAIFTARMLRNDGQWDCQTEARAALTAAAEISECKKCGGRGYLVYDAEWEPYAVQCPDCAAAAEVGEPKPTLAQIARTAEVITRAKVETIERCAQIADKNGWEATAAEIRALKDQSTPIYDESGCSSGAGIRTIDPNLQYPGKDPDFVFPEEE